MTNSGRSEQADRVTRAFRLRRWLRAWTPAFLWAAFVFIMSAMPGNRLPPLSVPNMDKVVHTAVYGVLGMLCWRGVRLTQALDPVRTVIMATAIAALYGITDELHQTFTPNRMADWKDAVADAGGSFLGALACAIASKRRGQAQAKVQATGSERPGERPKVRSENRGAPL
jgi:VanZ family protein